MGLQFIALALGEERQVACNSKSIVFVGGPGVTTVDRVYVTANVERKCGSTTYKAYLEPQLDEMRSSGEVLNVKVANRATSFL